MKWPLSKKASREHIVGSAGSSFIDRCKVETFASSGSAGAEGITAISAESSAFSDPSFIYNRDGSFSFSIRSRLSSNTSDATMLPSLLFPISESNLCQLYVFLLIDRRRASSLSLSNNLIFFDSCSRSCREDLEASSSVTVFASASEKP